MPVALGNGMADKLSPLVLPRSENIKTRFWCQSFLSRFQVCISMLLGQGAPSVSFVQSNQNDTPSARATPAHQPSFCQLHGTESIPIRKASSPGFRDGADAKLSSSHQ